MMYQYVVSISDIIKKNKSQNQEAKTKHEKASPLAIKSIFNW